MRKFIGGDRKNTDDNAVLLFAGTTGKDDERSEIEINYSLWYP